MRDPELWKRLKAKRFNVGFHADVQASQNGDATKAEALTDAFRQFLFLSQVSEVPIAVPPALAPVLEAYQNNARTDGDLGAIDPDASLGELLALCQLEFGRRPLERIWGEKVAKPQRSGIRPIAGTIAGGLGTLGVILAVFGRWWFFLPILAALIVLAGLGRKSFQRPGFHYDVPPSHGG